MIMMKKNRKYRFICILDSLHSPYLHIHILDSSYLKPLAEFSFSSEAKNHDLFQWGDIADLEKKSRRPKVTASEIKKFGTIGIGSAWMGVEGIDGCGGGEGFFFNGENFRIIKGNEVVAAKKDETYWNFQIADFDGAKKIDLGNKKIFGRMQLTKILSEIANKQIFISSFDAEFVGDYFARSNGIFDSDEVENRTNSLFLNEIKGGHLVGGSKNSGDLKSLRLNFSDEQAQESDFTLELRSEILLKPAQKIVNLA